MAWYKDYPKRIRGDDLLGKELTLIADLPPEDTQFGGMKMVTVMHQADSARFKVMMTEQDIAKACDIVSEGKSFTFTKGKDDKYATVKVFPKVEK